MKELHTRAALEPHKQVEGELSREAAGEGQAKEGQKHQDKSSQYMPTMLSLGGTRRPKQHAPPNAKGQYSSAKQRLFKHSSNSTNEQEYTGQEWQPMY